MIENPFELVMSLPAISLGDTIRFSVSRKVWDRPRGRWMRPKGANSMAMVGLGFKKVLVGTVWAILSSCALQA